MRAVKIKAKTQTEAETDSDTDMRVWVGVWPTTFGVTCSCSIQQSNHYQTNHRDEASTSTPPHYQHLKWGRRFAQSQWLTCGLTWYASDFEPAFTWQTRNHGINFNMTFGAMNWFRFKTALRDWVRILYEMVWRRQSNQGLRVFLMLWGESWKKFKISIDKLKITKIWDVRWWYEMSI